MADTPQLDDFTRGYLECALWTSDPYRGRPGGEWSEHDDWTIDNIAPESLARAIEVCADFQRAQRSKLDYLYRAYGVRPERNGHDFWLTRNGHGAGFWDRGYGPMGDALSAACRPYGTADVFGPETKDNGTSTDEQIDAWDKVIYIHD